MNAQDFHNFADFIFINALKTKTSIKSLMFNIRDARVTSNGVNFDRPVPMITSYIKHNFMNI